MLKNILKFSFGVLIFPVAVGASAAFYYNLSRMENFSGELHIFVWGIACYIILHLLFYKPKFFYVLGHEAIHAVSAWLCGGKIMSFEVNKEGGRVVTDKTNTFINLSPYFIPIYTILIVLAYYILSSSYDIRSQTFIFLIGFSLAFHIISTVEALKIQQPDIVNLGPLFPIVLVYILNVVVIALLFCFLFREFTVKNYFRDLIRFSGGIYYAVFSQLFL
ncbi:hypothetical protein ACFL42_03270 [Candidatus Omnitrophota bacterium]